MPLDIQDLPAIFAKLPPGHYASVADDGEILISGADHDKVLEEEKARGFTRNLFIRRPPNDNLWFL